MPTMTAEVSAARNVHTRTYARHAALKPVHNNLGSSFFLYRSLISVALKKSDPKGADEAAVVLSELHDNMYEYWYESFNPSIKQGYRLGASQLSDDFIQAAAGKHTGDAAVQINKVSDKAFIQGYNAALNKGWDRAVAWDRISEAYGLDPAQMRKWVTGYPSDGYHPERIAESSNRSLQKMLFDRSERISGHELWTAVQMGKSQEIALKVNEGILPPNTVKVWITAGDELVCPTCGPLEGTTTAPDKPFELGVYAPPAHVNCRCEIDIYTPPEVVTKAQGQDKYDRDSGGQFSASEERSVSATRRAKAKSPFITSQDPDQWGYAEPLEELDQSHLIPEEIDAKKELADAEKKLTHLKGNSEEIPVSAEEKQAADTAKSQRAASIQAKKEADLKTKAEDFKAKQVDAKIQHEQARIFAGRKEESANRDRDAKAKSSASAQAERPMEHAAPVHRSDVEPALVTTQIKEAANTEVGDTFTLTEEVYGNSETSRQNMSDVGDRTLTIARDPDAVSSRHGSTIITPGEYRVVDIVESDSDDSGESFVDDAEGVDPGWAEEKAFRSDTAQQRKAENLKDGDEQFASTEFERGFGYRTMIRYIEKV